MRLPREFYIPKGAMKVSDKLSDAVAYVSINRNGKPGAVVFYGKQAKPVADYYYLTETERAEAVQKLFANRREIMGWKDKRKVERKIGAESFRASVEVGDIFHYSFGYDETHNVFVEVTEIKGKYAVIREVTQAQRNLGYDNRYQCGPQPGDFCGQPQRVLLQDGYIKVGRHFASKWNTGRVAGVPVGRSYTGGGTH
jgi:hypothetical protein